MLHTIATLLGVAATWAAPDSHFPDCDTAFGARAFYETAGVPIAVIDTFVGRLGPVAAVLVGPNSIRERLDRAFVRHLVARFAVLGDDVLRECTVTYRNRTYRVARRPGETLSILHDDVPVVVWQQFGASPRVSAAEAMAEQTARADGHLILDPERGLVVFKRFLEDEVVIADRATLAAEFTARDAYLDRVRSTFNRRADTRVMADGLWRVHPKR